jgi:hypothetical protein
MEQLTKKQERALDKMIKVIMRKYPFITGWNASEDFLKWDTMVNIDIMVDYDKLAKFFDADTDEGWKRILDDEGGTYSMYSLGGPFSYDKYPHIRDLSYDTSAKIEKLLTAMNHDLPEGFSITYPYENFRGEIVNVPRQLRRDNYIFQ